MNIYDHKPIINKAVAEILLPTHSLTHQHLEVNEIEYDGELPKTARINENFHEDLIAVYFPVKNERYFIVVNVSTKEGLDIDFVWVESGHRVYLTAVSDKLSFPELSALTKLNPLTGWSIGDIGEYRTTRSEFSRITFEPIENEAYDLDEKLILLLDELEKDREGVLRLTENAETIISVCRHQYVSGNAGISLDTKIIQRLSHLNLGIDIDTYIVGNRLKD